MPPPFAACRLVVQPLFVMPGLVGGPQPNVRRDHVDGPVAHNQPLVLRFGQKNKPAALGPRAAMRLTAGAAQWRNTRRRPRGVGVAERCIKCRDVALVRMSVRRGFAFGTFVKITGHDDSTKLHAQVADEQQEGNAHGPPLGTLAVDVDVGDREVGARRVGSSAKLATNYHSFNGPCRILVRARDLDRSAREVARKSIDVEERGAMVLGGDVEVLRKGTGGQKACTFLHADDVPRSVEVVRKGALICVTRRTRVPGKDQEQDQESDGATVSRTRGLVPDLYRDG